MSHISGQTKPIQTQKRTTGGLTIRSSSGTEMFKTSNKPVKEEKPEIVIEKQEPVKEEKPEIVIEKREPVKEEKPVPASTPFSIVRRERNVTTKKPLFDLKNVWTLEQAKSFRQAVAGLKIVSQACMRVRANMNRFRLSQKRRTGSRGPTQLVKIPEEEKFITTKLNQLTFDSLWEINDDLTVNREAFTNESYIRLLANKLDEQARLQPLFSMLYAMFASGTIQQLNNVEHDVQRNLFIEVVTENAMSLFERDWSQGLDQLLASGSYLGCLVNQGFIDPRVVFDAIVGVIQRPLGDQKINSNMLEILGKIIIPSGKKFDDRFKEEAVEKVYKPLIAWSKDKEHFGGRVRYFIVDILAARDNGWVISHLINERSTRKVVRPQAITMKVQKDTASSELRRQMSEAKKTSKFAGLMDDDDEDEFEEEEDIDINYMIREYINDGVISSGWRVSETAELLLQVAMRPANELKKALKIFRALDEEGKFDSNIAKDEIVKVVEKCYEVADEQPVYLENCGAIFAKLVEIEAGFFDLFQKAFPKFNAGAVISFLNNMVASRKTNMLAESKYWTTYQWRPEEGVSHVKIAQSLPEDLLDIFVFYDNVLALVAMLEDNIPVEELVEELKAFPEEIITTPGFAVAAAEALVAGTTDPAYYSTVFSMVPQHGTAILRWIEWNDLENNQGYEQIAQHLKGIARSGNLDLQEFCASAGSDAHQAIVAALK